jgi:hypothetical protein
VTFTAAADTESITPAGNTLSLIAQPS